MHVCVHLLRFHGIACPHLPPPGGRCRPPLLQHLLPELPSRLHAAVPVEQGAANGQRQHHGLCDRACEWRKRRSG